MQQGLGGGPSACGAGGRSQGVLRVSSPPGASSAAASSSSGPGASPTMSSRLPRCTQANAPSASGGASASPMTHCTRPGGAGARGFGAPRSPRRWVGTPTVVSRPSTTARAQSTARGDRSSATTRRPAATMRAAIGPTPHPRSSAVPSGASAAAQSAQTCPGARWPSPRTHPPKDPGASSAAGSRKGVRRSGASTGRGSGGWTGKGSAGDHPAPCRARNAWGSGTSTGTPSICGQLRPSSLIQPTGSRAPPVSGHRNTEPSMAPSRGRPR